MSELASIRIDRGRSVVFFGDQNLQSPIPPYGSRPGVTFHPQGSFGWQFRF
jgi:hypothetical protein